jgi:uncharacterized phiE125 gp8 family phage protein
MGMAWKQTVAPVSEPITLADAKLFLKQDESADDALINSLISGAREYAETHTMRQLLPATWLVTLDQFFYSQVTGGDLVERQSGLRFATIPNRNAIRLPFPPLRAITSIQYYDFNNTLQTLDPSVYEFDNISEPARVAPVFGQIWPITYIRFNAVQITFTAGYDDASKVPMGLLNAMKAAVLFWYENRGDNVQQLTDIPLPKFIDRILQTYWVGDMGSDPEGYESCR